ncbi:hypothetical protein A2690_00765 [Candidatus Roizmanbacteria bacterium RIFCSPHIGHO2_01_FULL_39_12b]|uniref:Methyltransferase n=1 Tax=Candidatus Roizmanbacteria bacterium RIFCSPHIGHO2_01_FULL_39_12b TaxID=1802030 RepID=A0A1F7GAN5_9BACT|nr:MAG: hypothetical protein A2690_00765 [Candidatus Roizmanbacteria bacterium RIFCSPHIGHO2_01_FULL_39_12b]
MKSDSVSSFCPCQQARTKFSPVFTFHEKKAFPNYEDAVIGKCNHCGVLKTVVFPKNFNSASSRPEMYGKNKEVLIRELYPIIKTIQKSDRRNVLDVGFSSGILINELQKQGIDTWGIELNKRAFKIAKNKKIANIFNGTLKDFIKKYPRRKFDAVIYNHVLEHIENLKLEIDLIKQIINENGLLIVGVPNRRNVVFYLRGIFWESLMPGEHIWHFTDHYLINFLEKNGFYIKDKFYANHNRSSLPLLKRIYFNILVFLNSLFGTGEAVTVIAQMR